MGYSSQLAARDLSYTPSHRQDSKYHGLCYTSCGALFGKKALAQQRIWVDPLGFYVIKISSDASIQLLIKNVLSVSLNISNLCHCCLNPQYSVTLQSEEQIAEECRRKASQGVAVTSYVKHQEICLHTLKSSVNIPLPLTAAPGFITDIGLSLGKVLLFNS